MELKEAIEILKKLQDWYKEGNMSTTIESSELEALDTVLQALEKLQKENELARKSLIENSNIADERNDLLVEVQKLKKENEKYRSGELLTANQVKSFEETTKKYYIHKDKIKEKIEELNKSELLGECNFEEIGVAINVLQELLKGE